MAKRGRKPSLTRKGYFYEQEEKAVVDYNNTNDEAEKNRIYNTYLKPAFEKMVSSLIRRYKFYIPDEDYDQTFNDTLSYLMTVLSCYDPSRGTKAYSYCGTVAVNYLKAKVKNYNEQLQSTLSYNDIVEELNNGLNYTMWQKTAGMQAEELIKKISSEIKDMIKEPEKNLLNNDEIKVGMALTELLDNWEEILGDTEEDDKSNKMNKSSILYFLKEQTLMDTTVVRKNMKKYKMAYNLIKNSMLSE